LHSTRAAGHSGDAIVHTLNDPTNQQCQITVLRKAGKCRNDRYNLYRY